MDRRSFLRGLGMVVAGVAIDQAIPLGRVWSFPSKIKLASSAYCVALQLENVREQLPLLWQGLPYFYTPESSGTWMGIDRKLDPYNLEQRLKEALADDTGFRITGITVPQGE